MDAKEQSDIYETEDDMAFGGILLKIPPFSVALVLAFFMLFLAGHIYHQNIT
jgi:hypothetical protein